MSDKKTTLTQAQKAGTAIFSFGCWILGAMCIDSGHHIALGVVLLVIGMLFLTAVTVS